MVSNFIAVIYWKVAELNAL